ncbi:hypothetical protein BD309DRAFT_146566 [Dichomitus squalens]|uniref:Uncharacterized protein n=1 Tax=Dichomitus squalens TaxID=114155 RepID=A0A4Q9PJ63_9APHY|nr:hypothetical protein BD309DRAFT_146566 [Dichomitus squalens]TBU54129.1 hypothetical protein BD310DRAFT_102651 [Dichomitus squalens]
MTIAYSATDRNPYAPPYPSCHSISHLSARGIVHASRLAAYEAKPQPYFYPYSRSSARPREGHGHSPPPSHHESVLNIATFSTDWLLPLVRIVDDLADGPFESLHMGRSHRYGSCSSREQDRGRDHERNLRPRPGTRPQP